MGRRIRWLPSACVGTEERLWVILGVYVVLLSHHVLRHGPLDIGLNRLAAAPPGLSIE